ncbi:MAG: HAD family hydrolase [Nonlabens sp.]
MIKMIATDIDGTLLDESRFLSTTTIEAFRKWRVPKILISARMPQAMYYLQEALNIENTPMICYNGALVLDNEKVLYSIDIPLPQIEKIIQIADANQLHLSLYRDKEWFVPAMDYWATREENNTRVTPIVQDLAATMRYLGNTRDKGGAHKVMLMGDAMAMNKAFEACELEIKKLVHLYRSKDTYTEITPRSTSKLAAIELLLDEKYPELGLENIVAFGDNYNDEEMIKAVGYGVAVENARDIVKQAARYTTLHHKKDGVAYWLARHQ